MRRLMNRVESNREDVCTYEYILEKMARKMKKSNDTMVRLFYRRAEMCKAEMGYQ